MASNDGLKNPLAARRHLAITRPPPKQNEFSEKNYITALARGLSVMRAFSGQYRELTAAEISKLVDLPRATVRRCLITLNALGYIETTGKTFRLTPQVLTLSQAYFSSSPLPHVVQPYIEQASKAVAASCSISVLVGQEVIYVARSSRRRPASSHREVGVNLPAYCTSMGRVLLANLPQADLDAYFKRAVLTKYTNKTIVDKTELRAILDTVKQNEYCIIDGELELGLRAIAVPVRNMSGEIVAAAHFSTEADRSTIKQLQNEFLPVLRQTVSQIRRSLVG